MFQTKIKNQVADGDPFVSVESYRLCDALAVDVAAVAGIEIFQSAFRPIADHAGVIAREGGISECQHVVRTPADRVDAFLEFKARGGFAVD